MNRFRFSLASSVVLLSLSGLALSSSNMSADFKKIKSFFAHPHKHKHKHKQNHVDLLFLQQADSGFIVPMKHRAGCYKLTLSNLHENILYFTDQPKRNAGNITNREFMEIWKHNTIVPNVAMQAFSISPDEVREINLVAALTHPKFSAKKQTITYTACIIQKDKEQQKLKKAELRSVNLFIDPLHQWPP